MTPVGVGRGAAKIAAFFFLVCFAHSAAAAPPQEEPQKTRGAVGQFSVNDLPADRDGSTLVTLPAVGRYAIRAKSSSGARIQLVDMISGPGDAAGAAGLRDGRIDALLDKGVYKIRLFGAAGANGKVKLTAEPFVEVETRRPTLTAAQIQSGELGDLSQRSYWVEVSPSGRISIEAVGRSLQDLRLWRSNGELIDVAFDKANIEPKPGHFMTRLRLEGAVPSGRYIVTAYGGEKLIWSDGANEQPFFLRQDSPPLLAAGIAEGVIGPFGSTRFEAPAEYDSFRLELPQQASAQLEARRGSSSTRSSITKSNREPVATARLATSGEQKARIEVAGFEGQKFQLRALHQESRHTFEASGLHLVSIDIAGEGGNEIPVTALFARIENDKTRVLASDMLRIGPGHAWRGKFNLRGGTTSLLFEATANGLVAIRSQGPKVRAWIEPALGALAPRADGHTPGQYDLQAGFYLLLLEPLDNAAGVIDVTLGQPGLTPQTTTPAPARTVISFGEQKLERDGSYLILANTAPSLLTGPRIVALPADIEKAPLPLWQNAGAEIVIPIRAPKDGKIVARDARGADVAFTLSDEKTENDVRFMTLRIAASDKARAIGLVFLPPPPKSDDDQSVTESNREHSVAAVVPGRPLYFDLARDEKREFRFDLPQGGLYRVETLGRLQTKLALAANLTPNIGEGEDNGPGRNALVTTYLRGGAYRAFVTAQESAGHLGLLVSPASLTTTTKLTSDASVRATLAGGKGAVIPIEIAQDGLYRLDLHGLQFDWRARLEDAEGWPLTKPGKLTRLTQKLEKGSYRLVVLPEDVEARMYARLRPVVTPPELQGHGPHPLPFGKPQKLQWREPQAKDAPRAPDIWRFSLRGDAEVELSIGEGMVGEIFKGEREAVGKAAGARKFTGRLGAGDYRVEARSLAHDDRLDYEISLTSKELQPNAPRAVDLPVTVPFVIAADSIVDLTSFGDHEISGSLKDASGAVVERLQGRTDDWNIALSRRLAAGSYTLELEELRVKKAGEQAQSEESSDSGADANANAQDQTTDSAEGADESDVELHFALLNETNDANLPLSDSRTIGGASAHVFALPPAPQGSLMLVTAQSTSEVALSIEKRDAKGVWRSIGTERGLNPIAAWPAIASDNGGDASAWRAVVWSVGGGEAPIVVAARAIEKRGRSEGEIAMEPTAIEGLAAKICVGLAAIPSASLVNVTTPSDAVLAGSWPGRLLQRTRSRPLAPQSERLWLVSRDDCKQGLRVDSFAWTGGEITLDLATGDRAELPLLQAPAKQARLWLARSAFAQPGVDAGRGMDATNGAALTLAGDKPLRIWNASGSGSLRVALQAIDVAIAAPAQGGAAYASLIAPKTAQPVMMSASDAPLTFDLASGLAAFSSPEEAQKLAIFGDDGPISRTQLNAPSKIWLVNMTDKPLPARVSVAPGARETLSFGRIAKRFYGAAGQIAYPIEGEKGDRLVVVGGLATFVGDNGSVTQGASAPIEGRGVATIDYKPGLVAFWIERNGKSPWPSAAARSINIPQRVTLEGVAMSFALRPSSPMMLDVKSSAPAIVAFTQNGRRELQAFPSGIEFHHYVSEGAATLEVFSPHDGPLAGTLDFGGAPIIEAKEGLNDSVTLAAGASALFSFETKRDGEIGIGLRSDPDRTQLRLLDASGKLLGEGLAQSMKLAPGRYVVEAKAPFDTPLSVVRLAVVGLSPPPATPPAEVVAELLEKAGLKKNKTR